MKYQFCKKINKSFITLSMGYFFGLGTTIIAGEVNHNLPIKNINTNISSDNKLSKMPIGDLDAASKKVQINRNPFQEPAEIEFVNVSNLNTSMNFKGLVQSQDKLFRSLTLFHSSSIVTVTIMILLILIVKIVRGAWIL